MANPASPGTFDVTITDRIDFWVLPPKSGNTGDLDQTITDRIDFGEYVSAPTLEARPIAPLEIVRSNQVPIRKLQM